MQGTSYFLEKSELKDYIILAEDNNKINLELESFLENSTSIDEFFIDNVFSLSSSNLGLSDGTKDFKMSQAVFVNTCNMKQQKFFDKENNLIENVADGEIWINYKTLIEEELTEGDIIYITTDEGVEKQYKIAGYMKDIFLGSEMMGAVRFLLSDNDFHELYQVESLEKFRFYSMNLNDEDQFKKEYSDLGSSNILNADMELVSKLYFMDMLMASVFIIVSICFIIMSILILRFTIVFTISEDIRQIGILKAIGINDFHIRCIYLLKYVFITGIGAIVGVICSHTFEQMLLDKALKNIVTDTKDISIIISSLCGIGVIAVVGIFGYLCTARLKKVSPLTAIRNGNNGERFHKKSILKLSKSKLNISSYLALNDILCNKKRFIVLGITFIIGVWLVTIPAISADTLKSDQIVQWFGIAESDLYLSDQSELINIMSLTDRNEIQKLVGETRRQVEELGYPVDSAHMDLNWRFKIAKEDRSFISVANQGTGVDATVYTYLEGTAPMLENEVAITHIVADYINANIGDTVRITTGGEEKEYMITALFQNMGNLGEGIRFSEKAQISYQSMIGSYGVQINFKEEYTHTELKEIQSKISEKYPNWTVKEATEFLSMLIGGVGDQIANIKDFTLCVVIFINALIILLLQKMFLIKDRGEIAFLKSLGIKNTTIIAWVVKRITFVNVIGALIATTLSVPLTQLTSGQIFKMMGASDIEYQVNIIDVFCVYPFILIVCGVIVTFIASLSVLRINAKDACEMES